MGGQGLQLTLGLLQGWQTNKSHLSLRYQLQFWLDVQCSALVFTFTNIFSIGHLHRADEQ
jgi:hypothetical protein